MKQMIKYGFIFLAIYAAVAIISTVVGNIQPVDLQWIVPGWYQFVAPWLRSLVGQSGLGAITLSIYISQAVMIFLEGMVLGGVVAYLQRKFRKATE